MTLLTQLVNSSNFAHFPSEARSLLVLEYECFLIKNKLSEESENLQLLYFNILLTDNVLRDTTLKRLGSVPPTMSVSGVTHCPQYN